ncbi:MAG: hypothetical protein AB1758_04305 [Candidatus Eremiobacterota bacterium]
MPANVVFRAPIVTGRPGDGIDLNGDGKVNLHQVIGGGRGSEPTTPSEAVDLYNRTHFSEPFLSIPYEMLKAHAQQQGSELITAETAPDLKVETRDPLGKKRGHCSLDELANEISPGTRGAIDVRTDEFIIFGQ